MMDLELLMCPRGDTITHLALYLALCATISKYFYM